MFPIHTWNVDKCDCNKPDCSNPAKHPRTMHGLNDATSNLEQIAKWWEQWPAANIGVRTGDPSGVVVVDVDTRHGGKEAWIDLMAEHDEVHTGPACLTGSGGMHLYYEHPVKPVRNSASLVAPGIDIRGDGGYVIAPPSIHMLGTSYTWIEGYEPWTRAPQPIPSWLLEAMLQSPKGGIGNALPAGSPIPNGKRRQTLLSIAGSMRQYGLGETAIFNALMAENVERCMEPLDPREVATLAADVVKRYEPSAVLILPSTKPNKEKAKARPPEPFTLADLQHEEIPPVRWAVPDFLPEGLAVLAGKAKLGKSWMALNLIIAVGEGSKAFHYFETLAGDCLYLALEDTKRRLKGRTEQLRPNQEWTGRVWCEVEWPTTEAGGLDAIEAWLGQHPEARLVVIDTFQKLKPKDGTGPKANMYAEDYAAVGEIKTIADRYGVCIMLITHLNKGQHDDWVNNITGSTGISGAADTLMNLDRKRAGGEDDGDPFLLITGRDVQEQAWGAKLSAEGVWKITGKLSDVVRVKEYDAVRVEMRRMWIDGIREVTPALMAKATGKRAYNCNRALIDATEEGFIERITRGVYMLRTEDQPQSGEKLADKIVMNRTARALHTLQPIAEE